MYAHKGKNQTRFLLALNVTVHSKYVIIALASAQAAAAMYSMHYANELSYILLKAHVRKHTCELERM